MSRNFFKNFSKIYDIIHNMTGLEKFRVFMEILRTLIPIAVLILQVIIFFKLFDINL